MRIGLLTLLQLAFCLLSTGRAGSLVDTLATGEGSFTYTDYKPLADKPIKVWYYVPERKSDAQVLIVMHGNSRNAEGYWRAMLAHAKHQGFLLLVPEFSTTYFPSSRDYHQGGMFTSEGVPVDRTYWTFALIEPLFDYVKEKTGNVRDDYFLYGFSAGSQFVHRFLMFHPQNRASRVVAAAAGTYTMPDVSIKYSYGLGNTGVHPKDLRGILEKDLTILVGDADTVLSRTDLVKTPQANRQGRDRVERGQTFYEQGKAVAERNGLRFRWKFALIPQVGHTQSQMAGPVVDILFGNKD